VSSVAHREQIRRECPIRRVRDLRRDAYFKTIGDLLRRLDIPSKTFLDQLVSQCEQFNATLLIDSEKTGE